MVVPRQPGGHAPLPRDGHRDRRLLQHRRLQRRHPRLPVDPGPPRRRPARRLRLSRPARRRSTGSSATRRSRSRTISPMVWSRRPTSSEEDLTDDSPLARRADERRDLWRATPSPGPRPVKILQIGEGVFLRGFVDWMVDVANEKGVYGGGVAVAAPRRHEGLAGASCPGRALHRAPTRPRKRRRRCRAPRRDDRSGGARSLRAMGRNAPARRLARAEVPRLEHDRSGRRRRPRAL